MSYQQLTVGVIFLICIFVARTKLYITALIRGETVVIGSILVLCLTRSDLSLYGQGIHIVVIQSLIHLHPLVEETRSCNSWVTSALSTTVSEYMNMLTRLLCLLLLNPDILLTCLSHSLHVFVKSGYCSFSLFTLLSERHQQGDTSIHNTVYL